MYYPLLVNVCTWGHFRHFKEQVQTSRGPLVGQEEHFFSRNNMELSALGCAIACRDALAGKSNFLSPETKRLSGLAESKRKPKEATTQAHLKAHVK